MNREKYLEIAKKHIFPRVHIAKYDDPNCMGKSDLLICTTLRRPVGDGTHYLRSVLDVAIIDIPNTYEKQLPDTLERFFFHLYMEMTLGLPINGLVDSEGKPVDNIDINPETEEGRMIKFIKGR